MINYFRFGNTTGFLNFLHEQASEMKTCLENFGLPAQPARAQAAVKAENLTERQELDSSQAALPPVSRSKHICLRLHKLIRYLILPLSASGIAEKDKKEQQVGEEQRGREHQLIGELAADTLLKALILHKL